MTTPDPEVRTAIMRQLKTAQEPLTARDLFSQTEIRDLFESVNNVSDYMGYLYRKGLVTREYKESFGDKRLRWGYRLREQDQGKGTIPGQQVVIMKRSAILITDDGKNVTIESGNVRIVINSRYGETRTDE